MISLVHVSDLHLSTKNYKYLSDRIEDFAIQINNTSRKSEAVIILVTGDITFSGSDREFVYAEEFFKRVLERIVTVKSKYVFFVPGNHDCSLLTCDIAGREILRNKIVQNGAGVDAEISDILHVQKSFRDFRIKMSNVDAYSPIQDLACVQTENFLIPLYLVNTAWMSMLDESKDIFLPERMLKKNNQIETGERNVLPIVAYHHPSSWLKSDNSLSLRRYFEDIEPFIFSGHEHESESYKKEKMGSSCFYFEGGDFDSNANFRIVNVDINRFETIDYSWNTSEGCFDIISKGNTDREKKSKMENHISTDYNVFLSDPGMLINHPRRRKLLLEDFFVDPYLSITDSTSSKSRVLISNEDSLVKLTNNKYNVIEGDNGYGKTSLAKTLIKRLIKSDNCAIYIDGTKDKGFGNSRVRFTNMLTSLIRKQYSNDFVRRFETIPYESRHVVIDNYHEFAESDFELLVLHECLSENFGNVHIFVNSFTNSNFSLKQQKFLIGFCKYSIEDFGPKLQRSLIEKWNNIEIDSDTEEMIRDKNEIMFKVINNLVKQSFIPPIPETLLTLLSTYESTQNKPKTIYGHLLRTIISNAMHKSGIHDDDQNEDFIILGEVSYLMHKSHLSNISFLSFKEIVNRYNDEHLLRIKSEELLENLIESSLLLVQGVHNKRFLFSDNDKIAFKYSYIYAFFVAYYFNENLTNESIETEILDLFEDIHVETNSRIIINMWYYSNDKKLMIHLKDKVSKTLVNTPIYLFEQPASCVTKINSQKRSILMQLKDVSDNVNESNKSLLDMQEEDQHSNRKNHRDYNPGGKRETESALFTETSTAFNLLSTISQIVKCYGGVLKKDEKLELIDISYSLGMKVMSIFMEEFSKTEDIVEYIRDEYSRDENLSFNDAFNKSVQYVSAMSQLITFAVLYKIGDTICSEKSELSVNDYCDQNISIGTKLLSLLTQFLFYRKEKVDFAINTFDDLKNDHFTRNIVRLIIWRYYNYNEALNQSERDRIISKLELGKSPKMLTLK